MDSRKMTTNRTVGIEMEGYLNSDPTDLTIPWSEIGHDGSLRGKGWGPDYDDDFWDANEEDDENEWGDNGYAVEIRTSPLNDLGEIFPIFQAMRNYGWHVDSHAGTHIHVDISDYSEKDKAKLLRFGKGIERIIFLFMEEYRSGNNYCRPIHKDWRKIFWKRSKDFKDFDWDVAQQRGLQSYISQTVSARVRDRIWNGKYQWLNVLGSRYPTAEFRIFHAVRTAEELIAQAQLAYSIVELVKRTEAEQLDFIIKSIHSQESIEDMIVKFFQVLDLSFTMEVKSEKAHSYLLKKKEEVLLEAVSDEELSV